MLLKILNKENGILLMETHEDNILFQAEQAKKFFDKVTVISDLTGRNRILLNKNPK